MMRTRLRRALLLFGITAGTALCAAEPIPVWDPVLPPDGTSQIRLTETDPAFKKIKSLSGRQLGISLSIRFDKPGLFAGKSAEALNFGLFQLRRLENGLLEATFLPERDEIRVTPLVLTSTEKIEYGKWYDIALNFSAERRRFSMYVNGKWQMDNAIPQVPDRIRRMAFDLKDFNGAVRHFAVYGMAMNSEELTPTAITGSELAALTARAENVSKSENPDLAAWGKSLAARLNEIPALRQKHAVSVARVKRIVNDLENAEKLIPLAGKDKRVVVFKVNPTSQEMYLPNRLPQDGEAAGSLRFFAAKGENTFGSVVIVPLRPVGKFTLRFTGLKNKGGKTIPAGNIDIKLVKCWYRCGGAWMTYHADKLTRILTPDLLLNDDSVIRVDENAQSNERLLHLAEGDRYVDNSLNGQDLQEFYMNGEKTKVIPFKDAATLQPVKMEAAGRCRQYLFTFQIPEAQADGFYHGALELVADGKVVSTLPVTFRVLPFVLPQPKTYYDITRPYFSHINLNWSKHHDLALQYKILAKYNFRHPSNILDSAESYQAAKNAGMDLKNIFSAPAPGAGSWEAQWGGNTRDIPEDGTEKLDKLFLENWNRISAPYKDAIKDANLYPVFTSEADHYRFTKELPDRPENIYHVYTNVKRFSHSMTEKFIFGALDGTDMDSSAQIHREWADIWHAAGARVINYAEPFPSAENPAWFRRKLGLELYKNHYDGHMMHGFGSTHWNEFTDWPEDPAYKNFGLAYMADGSFIERLCLVGCAEGYNDVRYATMLRELAIPALQSKDPLIVKEAKRQLAWLETVDGLKYDMVAFRQGCASRILTMLELQKERAATGKHAEVKK